MDQLYEDKLDDSITKKFYEEKSKIWIKEQNDILSSIEKHKKLILIILNKESEF